MNKSANAIIRFDLPYKEAKKIWTEQFEKEYLSYRFAQENGITQLAQAIDLDRKFTRTLLRKYQIKKPVPIKTASEPQPHKTEAPVIDQIPTEPLKNKSVDPKLWKQFYNGINFKRGMIAYLHFGGERTTRKKVYEIARRLGGQDGGWKTQNLYWNRLQAMLCKLGILVSTTSISVYDWNDELVPIEFKQALAWKRAGASAEEILAFYFPNEIN